MNKLISLESISLITFIFNSFPRVVSEWRMDCIFTLGVSIGLHGVHLVEPPPGSQLNFIQPAAWQLPGIHNRSLLFASKNMIDVSRVRTKWSRAVGCFETDTPLPFGVTAVEWMFSYLMILSVDGVTVAPDRCTRVFLTLEWVNRNGWAFLTSAWAFDDMCNATLDSLSAQQLWLSMLTDLLRMQSPKIVPHVWVSCLDHWMVWPGPTERSVLLHRHSPTWCFR